MCKGVTFRCHVFTFFFQHTDGSGASPEKNDPVADITYRVMIYLSILNARHAHMCEKL